MSTSTTQKKPDNIVWIEEVLLNNLEENGGIASGQDPTTAASVHFKSGQNESPKKSNSKDARSHQSISSQELKIGIAEIELKDENFLGDDRIQTLSRILTGKIKYFIENRDEEDERYQYWIIKLPTLIRPQRELSQVVNAAQREIAFYTQILPDLKTWLDSRYIDHPVEFRVPTCFYGKYQRPVDKTPDLDIITHILDSESLLVLDDLRASGFGKRHFGSGLIISEAFAVIEEIVKFHVTSWAMQEIDKGKLNWPELFGWQRFAQLYFTLLENGFSTFQSFMRESRHPHAKEILAKVARLRPHLLNKLYSLLMPSEYPLPNTLVHMDLWSENLLFRMKEEDREDGIPLEEADLDCSIIDWQMVSYGRPTHDLALLIMLSMEPDYRREHTVTMLQYYYLLFEKMAEYFDLKISFDFEMLKKEFERSCVLATLMAMASIDIVIMEESTQNRLVEALNDLVDENLI